MFLSDMTRIQVVKNAWAAYVSIQKSIDALASIGLDLDGSSSNGARSGCQHLYGAMTDASNIIAACFGIEKSSVQAEQLDMFLSQTASGADPTDRNSMAASANRIITAALDMADTANKSGMGGAPGADGFYEVTVAMSGGVTVKAGSGENAMELVNAMDTDKIIEQAAWDSPSVTDAYAQ